MEAKLENILDNMMENDGTVGALVADNQGLCFGSEYKVKPKNSEKLESFSYQLAEKLHQMPRVSSQRSQSRLPRFIPTQTRQS